MKALRFLLRLPLAICCTVSAPLVLTLIFAMGDSFSEAWDLYGRDVVIPLWRGD